ncbi:MAG: flavoprotein [Planctomycetota bacterium]|jgi:phosphopantothenoylcysteine decarboxylase/phosphopantothenate--cysteine ligase
MNSRTKKPTSSRDDAARHFTGFEVLVCVTGGIAAYKVCDVVSQLVQNGAGTTVAMTRAARRFVGPVTFQALTGRRVATSLWHKSAPEHGDHIGMTDRADLIIVAPATADILGKFAGGIADDLVSTMLLGADSPILCAPAMNNRMWAHPIVQENVEKLKSCGVTFVGPGEGWLACRSVGPGRMVDPDEILAAAASMLQGATPKAGSEDGVSQGTSTATESS